MTIPRPRAIVVDTWLPLAAIAGATLFLSAAVVIGSDSFWLVAVGDEILRKGRIPDGLPYATATSSAWVNVPVAGEVLFALVNRLGPVGLPLFQVIAVALALALVSVGARRMGANGRSTALALALVVIGALPSLGVVRSQLLSLVPFTLLLVLLRADRKRPSGRIWLVPLLIAVWGNLHGAVLVGVAVTGAYLLFSRLRTSPTSTVAVGVVAFLALWLTPGLLQTGTYYISVLTNEAAHRGSELWAAPQFNEPFDVLLILAGLVLVASALLRRLPVWEYVALIGLATAVIFAARHGIWLLFFASPLAASTWSRRSRVHQQESSGRGLRLTAGVLLMGVSAAVLASHSTIFERDAPVVQAVRTIAGGRAVLATEPLAETLATGGVRVWASNPIDAFSRDDQSAFLDFLSGAGATDSPALQSASVVVAPIGSDAQGLATRAGFVTIETVDSYAIMSRPTGAMAAAG